jgi:hypothetical protein
MFGGFAIPRFNEVTRVAERAAAMLSLWVMGWGIAVGYRAPSLIERRLHPGRGVLSGRHRILEQSGFLSRDSKERTPNGQSKDPNRELPIGLLVALSYA